MIPICERQATPSHMTARAEKVNIASYTRTHTQSLMGNLEPFLQVDVREGN